ncbi:MAG: hypothetical protein ABL879_01600 [Devosia sp.]
MKTKFTRRTKMVDRLVLVMPEDMKRDVFNTAARRNLSVAEFSRQALAASLSVAA